jgi:hypothetical protein
MVGHGGGLRGCRLPCRRQAAGFSLPELLLAFGLGLGLCGLMLQSVLAEGQNGQRLARLLRERQAAGRALALLRSDLQRATEVASSAGPAGEAAACTLAGRAVVLHLQTAEGPITYSIGKPAEPIWRGQVLMRCGPAFGLDGSPSQGQALNRVLLDGLASGGARALQQGPGTLRVELRQQLPVPGQPSQVLTHQRLLPMP